MNIILTIYISGYLASYYIIKKDWDKEFGDASWRDIKFRASFSLLSWLSFLISLPYYIKTCIKFKLPKNPPK